MITRLTVTPTGTEGDGCSLVVANIYHNEREVKAVMDGMQAVLDYAYGCGSHTVEHTRVAEVDSL